jgi:hypothetical protein
VLSKTATGVWRFSASRKHTERNPCRPNTATQLLEKSRLGGRIIGIVKIAQPDAN